MPKEHVRVGFQKCLCVIPRFYLPMCFDNLKGCWVPTPFGLQKITVFSPVPENLPSNPGARAVHS